MTQEHGEGQAKRQRGDTTTFPSFKDDQSENRVKILKNKGPKTSVNLDLLHAKDPTELI